jgi:hypothetical protein
MSTEDRRPRRIIPGPPLPLLNPAVDIATLLQQHRFQRALTPPVVVTRRIPEPARERRGTPEAPSNGAAPSGGAVVARPAPKNDAPAQAAAPANGSKPRRTTGTRAALPREVPVPELPPRPDPLEDPQAWKHAGLAAPAPDHWDRDLADRIALLCKRADKSFQSWSVTVPLDPAVLPDTELSMSLSLERLALRFQTHSSYSLALVTRHKQRLVASLERALPVTFSRDIDVETA